MALTAEQLAILKATIAGNKPKYGGHSHEVQAKLYNTVEDRANVDRTDATRDQLQRAVVASEYLALTVAQRQLWADLLAIAPIHVGDTAIQAQAFAIWTNGSTTRTNLIALAKKTATDREADGLPFVTTSDVADSEKV